MTKADLVKEVSSRTGIDQTTVLKTTEALMETIKKNMSTNKNIYLRGFGTFEIKKRAKKTARNISKNTTIIVPEHFIPFFRASKEFKALLRRKGN